MDNSKTPSMRGSDISKKITSQYHLLRRDYHDNNSPGTFDRYKADEGTMKKETGIRVEENHDGLAA